jgi:hypothetical protein
MQTATIKYFAVSKLLEKTVAVNAGVLPSTLRSQAIRF